MKKLLVLALVICLWAGNAYAARYDATGIWNITNDWEFTPDPGVSADPQTGTDYRTWDIYDNLSSNEFTMDYIGPGWEINVTGDFNVNNDTYDADPFTQTLPHKYAEIFYLSFWLTTPTTLIGESDIIHYIHPSDNPDEWVRVGTIHCEYSGELVPIPSALWLLGSGLIGIVGVRRKYKKF